MCLSMLIEFIVWRETSGAELQKQPSIVFINSQYIQSAFMIATRQTSNRKAVLHLLDFIVNQKFQSYFN